MSKKHNTKHRRSRSRYVDRLEHRKCSPAEVRMDDMRLSDGKPASAKR